ncbi:MAG: SurA N-terminal domain-containing protein [Acidiferrobacterales bacterium]
MLAAIRDRIHGIVAGFFVGLIILVFLPWGVYSYLGGDTDINVAEVDGVKISQRAYRLALDRLLSGNLNPALLDNVQFKRQVLDGLIDQTLMMQNALNQSYRVGNADLGRLIREAPELQREGRFDTQLYEAVLRREGLSKETFEERLRANRVSAQIQSGLRESELALQREKVALLRLWRQTREFDYVVIAPARFMQSVDVTDDEIKEYYESHVDDYKTPEQVRIEYVRLAAEDLAADYKPTEGELHKAYEQDVGRYTVAEKRRVSHILIELAADAGEEAEKESLEKARDIEKQLRAGADFASLAKEHSADSGTAANGGDLGYIERNTLPAQLEKVVFALEVDAISEPVRTDDGYHIVKLTEHTPPRRKPFEEARADIEKLSRQQHGEEQFYEKFEEMTNLVYEQPDSLKPVAEALGLEIKQSDWFDRGGGAGITAQPKVIGAAFSPEVLVESLNSDTIEIGRDTLVALRAIGHREAARKPLAEVRDAIKNLLQKERAREEATKLGVDVVDQLRGGKRLDVVAKDKGLTVQQAKLITRLKPQAVDRRIVAAAFKARRPKAGEFVYGEVDLGDRGYAVFALTRVEEGNTEEVDEALKRRVEDTLRAREGLNYFADYLKRLRKTADIKVFADRL